MNQTVNKAIILIGLQNDYFSDCYIYQFGGLDGKN